MSREPLCFSLQDYDEVMWWTDTRFPSYYSPAQPTEIDIPEVQGSFGVNETFQVIRPRTQQVLFDRNIAIKTSDQTVWRETGRPPFKIKTWHNQESGLIDHFHVDLYSDVSSEAAYQLYEAETTWKSLPIENLMQSLHNTTAMGVARISSDNYVAFVIAGLPTFVIKDDTLRIHPILDKQGKYPTDTNGDWVGDERKYRTEIDHNSCMFEAKTITLSRPTRRGKSEEVQVIHGIRVFTTNATSLVSEVGEILSTSNDEREIRALVKPYVRSEVRD